MKNEDIIDFSKLKDYLNENGLKISWLAQKVGQDQTRISQIIRNVNHPKTDLVARICSVLKVPPSAIVSFKLDENEKKKAWFDDRPAPFIVPENPTGELTYEPLWQLVSLYLGYINEKKNASYCVSDIFDRIEPYRRRAGLTYSFNKETLQKSLEARGLENSKPKRKRKYVAKGLTPEMRTKLKNDRPLNIRAVYDICNFFGCSIDWVMSYR